MKISPSSSTPAIVKDASNRGGSGGSSPSGMGGGGGIFEGSGGGIFEVICPFSEGQPAFSSNVVLNRWPMGLFQSMPTVISSSSMICSSTPSRGLIFAPPSTRMCTPPDFSKNAAFSVSITVPSVSVSSALPWAMMPKASERSREISPFPSPSYSVSPERADSTSIRPREERYTAFPSRAMPTYVPAFMVTPRKSSSQPRIYVP